MTDSPTSARRRSAAWMRAAARRLPITGAYERRIAELTADVHRLAADYARELRFKESLFVVPGHFYSPIPPPDELHARRDEIMAGDPLDVPGVDLDIDRQRKLLDELAPLVATVPFHAESVAPYRYGYQNFAYGHGDGLFLHLLLRHLRPRRIVELGSGWSSACTLDTIEHFFDAPCDVTFVDPHPELLRSLLQPGDEARTTILPTLTQDVDPAVFAALEEGDVLFIDSTHVLRTGGDVAAILFRILPALAPGVVVHFHDVFDRFEYPWPWIEEGRAWNEAYALRAFLQYNDAFRILLWPCLMHRLDPSGVEATFPPTAQGPGGALWLVKNG